MKRVNASVDGLRPVARVQARPRRTFRPETSVKFAWRHVPGADAALNVKSVPSSVSWIVPAISVSTGFVADRSTIQMPSSCRVNA